MPTRRSPGKRSNLPLLGAMAFVVLLLVVLMIEGVIILLPQGAAKEAGASLSVLQGRAFVQRGGEGDWVQVDQGFVVRGGDRIRVADASQATLTFVEGTSTDIRAFTELTVRELHLAEGEPVAIGLDLTLGEIWNRIGALPAGSLHEVTTVAASMIARGSDYGVAVNQEGTAWLTGHEGEIEVNAGGQTVQLISGDLLVIEPGLAPVPYQPVALAPAPDGEEEPAAPGACSLESVDLGSFGNEPLPTGTPTHTPTATATTEPTHTAMPTPTATTTRVSCPTLIIKAPHTAFPIRAFGMEWDVTGSPIPAGWEFVIEYSADPSPQAAWQRAQPDRVYQEGGHWKADLHGPGAGNWLWRVCLVPDPTGPVQVECCSEPHLIVHERGGDGDEEYPDRDY